MDSRLTFTICLLLGMALSCGIFSSVLSFSNKRKLFKRKVFIRKHGVYDTELSKKVVSGWVYHSWGGDCWKYYASIYMTSEGKYWVTFNNYMADEVFDDYDSCYTYVFYDVDE